jgi:formylmethanofuran dehydrogenase subunit E
VSETRGLATMLSDMRWLINIFDVKEVDGFMLEDTLIAVTHRVVTCDECHTEYYGAKFPRSHDSSCG